jgi:hypothetical protein
MKTYIRVAGRWAYLYRAVDSEKNTIDFMLSPNRDLMAAKHFLQAGTVANQGGVDRQNCVRGHVITLPRVHNGDGDRPDAEWR